MVVKDMVAAYGLGKAMGQGWHDMDAAIHERDVSTRMNDILQAVNEVGGDITMLDPKFSSDRVGLEAMGRVAKQLSNTEEYQTRIMRNNIEQAHHLYGVISQYKNDIGDSIKSGDQQRTYSLMGAAMQQLGTPYTLFQTEDGKMHWGYKTRDGVQDKGEADPVELFQELNRYIGNKGSFIKAITMHRQAMQQENSDNWNDLSKWRTVYDKNGTPFTAIEMNVWDGDSYEPGFMVQTPNGLVEMTSQQLLASGLSPNRGQGLRMGGGVGKDAAKIIDAASTVVDPETGEKRRDPYMAKALTMLTQQMGDPDSAMMALQEWERVLAQDEAVAERLAAMPAGQKAMAIIEIMQQQARPAQKQKPVPQKDSDRAGLHARIRDAAAGKGKPDRIATMPAHQSGSFGLYPWNQ